MAQGKYNEQIAMALGIAEGTVKNQVKNLHDKLQVHSRDELVAYAWQHGIVASR
jgi:DNA-binding CsgD family transcriptional regulator